MRRNNTKQKPNVMKKNLMTLICSRAVVLCCVMATAVFTACTDNDDNPVIPDNPTAQAEYAILFYAYGYTKVR